MAKFWCGSCRCGGWVAAYQGCCCASFSAIHFDECQVLRCARYIYAEAPVLRNGIHAHTKQKPSSQQHIRNNQGTESQKSCVQQLVFNAPSASAASLQPKPVPSISQHDCESLLSLIISSIQVHQSLQALGSSSQHQDLRMSMVPVDQRHFRPSSLPSTPRLETT